MPQFRKGQSGNPAGRPPGSRNRATSMVQSLLEGAAGKHRQACRPAGRGGQRGRHPNFLRFVEALSTPVVAPVMCLFGGRRNLLFVSPSK
jgi:hypothetical protein